MVPLAAERRPGEPLDRGGGATVEDVDVQGRRVLGEDPGVPLLGPNSFPGTFIRSSDASSFCQPVMLGALPLSGIGEEPAES